MKLKQPTSVVVVTDMRIRMTAKSMAFGSWEEANAFLNMIATAQTEPQLTHKVIAWFDNDKNNHSCEVTTEPKQHIDIRAEFRHAWEVLSKVKYDPAFAAALEVITPEGVATYQGYLATYDVGQTKPA